MGPFRLKPIRNGFNFLFPDASSQNSGPTAQKTGRKLMPAADYAQSPIILELHHSFGRCQPRMGIGSKIRNTGQSAAGGDSSDRADSNTGNSPRSNTACSACGDATGGDDSGRGADDTGASAHHGRRFLLQQPTLLFRHLRWQSWLAQERKRQKRRVRWPLLRPWRSNFAWLVSFHCWSRLIVQVYYETLQDQITQIGS